MSKRAIKVTLNDKASDELKEIASELGLSETEVLRKGLLVMGLYAKLKHGEQRGALLLKEGDQTRELLLA
jgi:predicted transcriptional regulator